jgi:hypothetical protein
VSLGIRLIMWIVKSHAVCDKTSDNGWGGEETLFGIRRVVFYYYSEWVN